MRFQTSGAQATGFCSDSSETSNINNLLHKSDIGKYRADLIAKNPKTERTVVIENQFGETDHKHLGQSLVYTAGKEADVVVWIAEDFTEEHVSVFRWLNSRTDSDVDLFAVEVSLYQIGDSPYAVELNAIETPDEWSDRIEEETMDETDRLYTEFWKGFKELADARDIPQFVKESPSTGASYRISIGHSGVYIRPTARLKSDSELVGMIRFTSAESTFAGLNQEEFEETLRNSLNKIETDFFDEDIISDLNWEEAEADGRFDKVTIHREIDTPEDESNWQEYHDWLIDTSLLFKDALEKRLE